MQDIRSLIRLSALVSMVLTSACALPRPGPNLNEIVEGSTENGGVMNVVLVSDPIARASNLDIDLGFSQSFRGARAQSTDMIKPGDTLTLTVWENVDNGLLASVGQKVTTLSGVQVDQGGGIFVPYAGRLQAAGQTPDQLRRLITRSLDAQTPDPQVEVRRETGDGASVSIIGGVGSQGVYPIVPSTTKLTGMIAQAGGVTLDPDIAQIAVRRGGHTGRIFLQDLYDDPQLDIALLPNDKIIVEEDRRTFTALGGTGTQALVKFPRGRINLVEALATVGGLNGNVSDPTGIFVFRRETAAIADRVLGVNGSAENQPFAYVVDLTSPAGFFIAREFEVRDGDTIYITEAPFVGWSRVLEATAGTLNFGTTIVNAADVLSD